MSRTNRVNNLLVEKIMAQIKPIVESVLNEKVESNLLRQVGDFFKKTHKYQYNSEDLTYYKMSDVLPLIDYANISDDDFVVLRGGTKEAKQMTERIISKRSNSIPGFIIIKDRKTDEIIYVINHNKHCFSVFNNSRQEYMVQLDEQRLGILNIVSNPELDIYVLDVTKFSTYFKRVDRQKSRDGYLDPRNEWAMRQLARENMERYKTILAQNRASKEDNFAKEIKELLNDYMDLVHTAMNSKDQVDYSTKLQRIGNSINGRYAKGLLTLLQEYFESKEHLKQGYRFGFDIVSAREKLSSEIADVRKEIDDLKEKMK